MRRCQDGPVLSMNDEIIEIATSGATTSIRTHGAEPRPIHDLGNDEVIDSPQLAENTGDDGLRSSTLAQRLPFSCPPVSARNQHIGNLVYLPRDRDARRARFELAFDLDERDIGSV